MPAEVDMLKLVEKLTNGCQINISKTGTKLIFKPGIIDCNEGLDVHHDCHLSRNIVYYLELVTVLGIFGKSQLSLKLTGNTDDNLD